MKTVLICLNSIDKVKSFVNEITKFDYDFDLVSGRYVIDAKSIMGIFSLDLSKPIDLNIHAEDDSDVILQALKPYIEFRIFLILIIFNCRSFSAAVFYNHFSVSFYSTQSVSAVSIAFFTISSISSCNFSSLRLITLIFGLVTGCFATKMVQQSS